MSSCCGDLPTLGPPEISRRQVLRAAGPAALAAPYIAPAARAAGKRLQIGFCSQFLCAPPYLTATAGEFFKREGLDVEIIYLRGSPSVIQALAGGALDYGASNFEDVLTATQHGVALTRFLSTANLPLLALAVAPGQAKAITSPKDLEGRTVGEVAAGAAAEGWTRNLMKRAGADPAKVRFVALGPNIFDPVRLGLVDSAWVGEPSLTLLRREGAGVLVNFMEAQDATRYLGGSYAFMGISVRRAEAESRRQEMLALGRAMNAALQALQQAPPETAVSTLPPALLAGLDVGLLADVLRRYRAALYPPNARIDVDACQRAFETLVSVGLVGADLDWRKTLDLSVVPS
jgi:ABC-type nitrate/sulfonate/bicarbonate transport system substrate-binding protein